MTAHEINREYPEIQIRTKSPEIAQKVADLFNEDFDNGDVKANVLGVCVVLKNVPRTTITYVHGLVKAVTHYER